MKLLLSLFVGSLASAQEAAAPLDLSKPPSFGEMTKVGIKFAIPKWLLESNQYKPVGGPRSPRQAVPQPSLQQGAPASSSGAYRDLVMEGESATFALSKGELREPPVAWSNISCAFSGKSLTEPGKYYPPKLPIADDTRISKLWLSTEGEDVPVLLKQAAETLKVLGVNDPKFETWVSSAIWTSSPSFRATYADRSPKVDFSFQVSLPSDFRGQPQPPDQQENPSGSFEISLSDWEPTP